MESLVLNIWKFQSHGTENIQGAVGLMLGRAHRKPKGSVTRTAEGQVQRRRSGREECGRVQESNQRCPWMELTDD